MVTEGINSELGNCRPTQSLKATDTVVLSLSNADNKEGKRQKKAKEE